MPPSLLFVYNADGGLFATVTDFAHKLLRPETYSCNLCAMTYGNFSMKKEWKDFISNLSLSVRFLHRDEFRQRYPAWESEALPTVFTLRDDQPEILLSASEINAQRTLPDLISILDARLAEWTREATSIRQPTAAKK